MKEIKAVALPQRLAGLHEALRAEAGFPGMTVVQAERWVGAEVDDGAPHSIRELLTDHVGRVQLTMVVSDDAAARLFDRLVHLLSATGQPGDAQVWMTDVERAAFVHRGP